jgi:hypothetical protein
LIVSAAGSNLKSETVTAAAVAAGAAEAGALEGAALLPPAVGVVLLQEHVRAAAATAAAIFKRRMARSFLERRWVLGSSRIPFKSGRHDASYV